MLSEDYLQFEMELCGMHRTGLGCICACGDLCVSVLEIGGVDWGLRGSSVVHHSAPLAVQ